MTEPEHSSKLSEIQWLIKEKWIELEESPKLHFDDYLTDNRRMKKGELEFKGVYVIYEGDTPIYVGSGGKGGHVLRYRIGDLFGYSPRARKGPYYHTLTRKLVNKGVFKEPSDVWEFFKKSCSFKVIKTENMDEARLLEQAFIVLYNHPKYNSP